MIFESKLGLVRMDQLIEVEKGQETPWIVEGFLKMKRLVILAGDAKAGKSALLTNLAVNVANGQPFLGMTTTQHPVLWMAFEESRDERSELLEHYPRNSPLYIDFCPEPINTDGGIKRLRAAIQETKAKLVIIDPLISALEVDSLSESKKTRQAMTSINELRNELDLTVILVHHFRKGGGAYKDRISDSHQLSAVASQTWAMEVKKSGNTRTITLHGLGRGDHANQCWRILSKGVAHFERLESTISVAAQKREPTIGDAYLELLESSDKPIHTRDAASLLGVNARTLANEVTHLHKQGRLMAVQVKGHKGKAYGLAPTAAVQIAA